MKTPFRKPSIHPVLTLLICLAVTLSARAQSSGRKVPLEKAPAAVQTAIQTQMGDGKLDEIRRTRADGKTAYEVSITKGDKERTFTVADDGKLTELQVFLEELPPDLQKAIQEEAGTNKLNEIIKSIGETEVVYDVTMTQGDKERFFNVASDLSWISVRMSLEELPAPAQKTIREQLGEGKLGEINRGGEAGEIVYDVTITKEEKERVFNVAEDGTLKGQQVFMEEVPEELQKAIREQVGEGKLGQIIKCFEDGDISYDATMIKGGKERSVNLAEDGALDSIQMFLNEVPEKVQKTIQEQVGDGRLGQINKNIEEDLYEAEIIKAGKKETISIYATGKMP